MDTTALQVTEVHKYFILPHERRDSIKQSVTQFFKSRTSGSELQHALQSISFDVKKGEFFGIVGRNGSGKSTLLKMLAGIYQPTKGHIEVHGKLVPFIELGVGFNPELTGRENVYLNGALLGFSKKQIDDRYEEIVRFAELSRFMDQKLKNYSSGMQVRLAFSVAIMADADILLVDEVLAVGDAAFQRKCFDYFHLLKRQKKTVVFVTHDMNAVREYCDRALLIEKSRIVDIGKPYVIANKYTELFNETTEDKKDDDKQQGKKRWGDKKMLATKAKLSPERLKSNEEFLTISIEVAVHEEIEEPVFGFSIKNEGGEVLLGTNSKIKFHKTGTVKKGEKLHIQWQVPNIFADGVYLVDIALQHRDAITVCDWWEDIGEFEVRNTERAPFPMNPPVKLVIKKEG